MFSLTQRDAMSVNRSIGSAFGGTSRVPKTIASAEDDRERGRQIR
jgi:hypothetical protein